MFRLCIYLLIVIFMFLAGCGGTRYNWVPQGSVESGPPNVEYEGTKIPDPNSQL